MIELSSQDRELLNSLQRDFPLCSRPFQQVAQQLDRSEEAIIERLQQLESAGAISRFGGVFTPNVAGASTLAALAVPAQDLPAVAAAISMIRGVNHNYQREHHFNLWFVVTARDRAAIDDILASIDREYGLPLLDLPLEEAFHIDLGFPL
jgi:DNA-binding Lrp family transcriptional regulator